MRQLANEMPTFRRLFVLQFSYRLLGCSSGIYMIYFTLLLLTKCLVTLAKGIVLYFCSNFSCLVHLTFFVSYKRIAVFIHFAALICYGYCRRYLILFACCLATVEGYVYKYWLYIETVLVELFICCSDPQMLCMLSSSQLCG